MFERKRADQTSEANTMKLFYFAVITLLTLTDISWGQAKRPRTLDELVSYTAADRQQIILDGAKAEGKLIWYTSLSGNYKEIVEAFKKKYPQVAIDVYRAGSNDVAQRLVSEAQAGRYLADALEVTPGSLILLRERNILKPFWSPELARYPEEARTKADGNRVLWVTDRESYLGFGYNTRMIAANEVPKNFEELLKPELKGKLAISTEASSSRVVGTMLKHKGDEFMKKLRSQEMKMFQVASTGFLDLMIAGEIAGSPAMFRNMVTVQQEKGAPVAWVPLDVSTTNAGGAAVINNAPHPHAALLFTDFIIGPDGQKLMEQFRYGVSWKEQPFKREYPEQGMSVGEYSKAEKQWSNLLRTLTRR
jgi:iron(III) transport system substrate-binding protein